MAEETNKPPTSQMPAEPVALPKKSLWTWEVDPADVAKQLLTPPQNAMLPFPDRKKKESNA